MSTVKVINVQHPSAASPNITGDANGNITFAGTAAMASSYIRNRIINGAFDIWQRGTSFTSSSVNEYSADRWRTEGYNTNSVISQQTFTVGQTVVPGYPRYFCRVTTSSAPSNYWAFQQRIECPHNINGDGIYTLSFWVKAVSGTIAAGTFKYGINDNSTYSNPALTTTWQKISVTQTLSGVSESSGYLSIYVVSIGSGVSSLSVDIANVQVEVGSVATPFERESYSVTLAKCQRYYQKQLSNGSRWLPTMYQESTYLYGVIPLQTQMRTGPSSVATPAASTFDIWGVGAPTAISIDSSTAERVVIRFTKTGLTNYYAYILSGNGTTYFEFGAEL